jgi:anthranilate synthase component 1
VTGTVRPSADEFLRLAERGNLIPVYRELLADGDTPVSAFSRVGGGDYSFLLESVVGGEKWAAYSFIGAAPRAVLIAGGGTARLVEPAGGGALEVTREWNAPDPAAALHDVLSPYRPVDVPGLPRFWGGAVGWIGYDAVRAFEPSLARGEADGDLPELCFALTDTVIIFDNLRQTVKVVAAAYTGAGDPPEEVYRDAVSRIEALIDGLSRPAALRPLAPPPESEDGSARLRWGGIAEPRSSTSPGEFAAAVERAKEYILAGDIFQVVLAHALEVPLDGLEPFDIYRALRVVNPSPYMFHLEYPLARVTGASPETLVRAEAGRIEVRPIAGTRPRGAGAEEDARLAAELLADPKERAEHLMLIDLGRNDVGRVAATGTVAVTQNMEVERFSHVMHLVSTVQGELRPGLGWLDVLRAAFPAGTLSGAPKIRAMEIIDELEAAPRGIYGGAVGYISYTGNMDLAIAIRTLVTRGDSIAVGVGAGIVADSQPAAEYEETLNKARAVLRAVALARGGK